MSGVLRLSNNVTGRSSINASATSDQTYTLPAIGGTLVTGGASSEIIFPSGTEALPGLHVQGDVDTGLYAPAANTLAISTDGSERLRIDSSGNVGIGVTSPGGKLHIKNTASETLVLERDGTATQISAIIMKDGSGNQTRISSTGGEQVFGINGTTEAMRIDSSGRLLVGTASAATVGQAQYGFLRTTGNTLGATSYGIISVGRGATASSGLGVGNNMGTITFTDSIGAEFARIQAATDGTTGANDYPGNLRFYTTADGASSTTERLRIDSAGQVGIGTTDPAALLQVGSYSGNNAIQIGAGSGSTSALYFGDSGTGADIYRGYIQYTHSSDALQFATSSTERMRLDSSGRLLISSTTARAIGGLALKLQVEEANGSGSGRIAIGTNNSTNAAGPGIYCYRSRGGTLNSNTIVQDDDDLGSIYFHGADGTDLENRAAQIRCEVDGTPGSNDIPGRLVFNTTTAGTVGTVVRMQIDNRGQISALSNGTPSVDNVFSTVASSSASTKIVSYRRNATPGSVGTGTEICVIRRNGDIDNTNNSYGPLSSDERLKQDIVDVSSQWEDIKNIRLTKFRFKNDPTGELQLGPIAQELELVCPGLIKKRPATDEEIEDTTNTLVEGDEVLSFKASILYMKAVKALQEAMTRIETLESEVAILRSK
jgi:hypothetical protein